MGLGASTTVVELAFRQSGIPYHDERTICLICASGGRRFVHFLQGNRNGAGYYCHSRRVFLILKHSHILGHSGSHMAETFQRRVISGRADAESLAIQVLNVIVADVDRIIQFLNIGYSDFRVESLKGFAISKLPSTTSPSCISSEWSISHRARRAEETIMAS